MCVCLGESVSIHQSHLDDFNRVVLQTTAGVENSDYINASFIDVSFSSVLAHMRDTIHLVTFWATNLMSFDHLCACVGKILVKDS